jgi:hypothetical protein
MFVRETDKKYVWILWCRQLSNILKYSIPCIFMCWMSLQLHELYAHFIFVTFIGLQYFYSDKNLMCCLLLCMLHTLRNHNWNFFLFTMPMYVFGFEQLLLSCIIRSCDSLFSMLQIILGSTGIGVFKKTPCPLVVVVMYLAWLRHY